MCKVELTRFKTSALNDILCEQIITKLSRPIFRSAKSVTAKLRISCTPYMELSIDDDPPSDGYVNCSGSFMLTHAIRDPSALYFSDNCTANRFTSLKISLISLFESYRYKNTCVIVNFENFDLKEK